MGLQRDGREPSGYIGVNPVQRPQTVVADRAPTTNDRRYKIGTPWIDKTNDTAYFLTSVVAGSATWALASPGASDVDTLTGNSGGALSPTAGNINILGGTNLTCAGAGSTLTMNMDAAISLATSVTSPLYTASAADVAVTAPAGQDIVLKVGDNAGANKLSLLDSDDVEVFSVDSNGGQTYTTITATGLITGQASATINTAGTALNLATDNSGDAVNIGNGTTIRAITIGSGAAHTVNIGTASAGAIAIDSAAAISIDAAAASNFSVSGAGIDLTLASSGGRVVVNGEEAAADALRLLSAAGGLDCDVALQLNLTSSQNAADAIRLNASAGGIDIDAAGAAGEDITVNNAAGSIALTSGEAIADSMVLTGGGGIDILAPTGGAGLDIDIVNTGGSVNVSGTEAIATAVTIAAANGGIDITAGGAALDVDISSSAGSVNITGAEDAADAVVISASAGGIDISATGEAGQDIDITNTGGSVNVTATENDLGAIYIHANGGTSERIRIHSDQGTGDGSITIDSDDGGITLSAGGADITVTGTVKEIDAEFLYSSGTDLVITQSPIMQSTATTGAAPTGTTGATNLMYLQDGCIMEQFILGAGQTIIAPRMDGTNGLLISLDLTDDEGAEYNFGPRNNAKHAYTIGTSDAFFLEAQIYAADLSGIEPLIVGFRKVAANAADYTTYTDFYGIGVNSATSGTNCTLFSQLNGGGVTLQDSGTAWTGGDGGTTTLKVLVNGSGVTTATIDGGAPATPLAFTFDNTDIVMPFIHFLHDTTSPGAIGLKTLKCGFQA